MTPQELEQCKDVFLADMLERDKKNPLAQWAREYGFKLIEHIEKLEGEHCIEMAVGQQQLDELLNENAALKRAAEAQDESVPSEVTPDEQQGFQMVVPVGLLGATVPQNAPIEHQLVAGLSEAESHILKLEKRVLDLERIFPK